MVDEQTVERLQETYPRTSWAIWSEGFPKRGCIEEDESQFVQYVTSQRHRLRPNIVFLGLNPSTEQPRNFQNFHSTSLRHADKDLRIVIEESGLEGGFMTDCSDTVEPDADELDLDSGFLEPLFDQFEILPAEQFTVICFGRQAFHEVSAVIEKPVEELAEGVRRVVEHREHIEVSFYSVYHYSQHISPKYLEQLRDQLRYITTEFV